MIKKLGLLTAVLATGAYAADGITVGGNVVGGYYWVKQPGADTNTFRFSEGSVSVGKKLGMGEALVDLVVAPNAANTALTVGAAGSQAYIAWKYENGFTWKLGQFDSLYGFESNKLSDIVFNAHGLMYNLAPTTHVGATVGYEFSDMLGLHLLVANRRDQSTNTAGNADFGFKIKANMDTFRASVGGLFGRQDDAKDWLFDVQAGATVGQKLNLDVYAMFGKIPTSGDLSVGLGVQGVYDVNEQVAAAARFEWTKNNTGSDIIAGSGIGGHAGAPKVWELAIGPQFKASKDLTIKADYALIKSGELAPGVSLDTIHAISIAGVYKF